MIWLKLDCLNPNLQQVKKKHPPERRLKPVPHPALACPRGQRNLRDAAMPSEGIEGDEWGAYVTLSRIAGTNAGSPTGREPYGDTGLVVVGAP